MEVVWTKLGAVRHYISTMAWGDWRKRVITCSVGAAAIATFAIWLCFPDATDVQTFFGAAFASWVGGFVLFIITGLVIAAVTLIRPDEELFEARARNLLQRQTGPHINYIVGKLHDLFEPYLIDHKRTLTIMDYDPVSGAFLVNQETELVYGSYLVDIPVTFDSRIGYQNGTPAPDGKQKCCITYLRVDGKNVGEFEEFETEVVRPFQMQVLPKTPVTVRHRMALWIREKDEPNRQRIIRFTRNIKVTVHNQLAARSIEVTQPGNADLNRVVHPGDAIEVVNLKEIEPRKNDNEFVFDFRLCSA
jgi:hypothetical protein